MKNAELEKRVSGTTLVKSLLFTAVIIMQVTVGGVTPTDTRESAIGELIGYSGWEDHEYKALREFLDQTKLEVEYIAYGLTYVLTRMSGSAA